MNLEFLIPALGMGLLGGAHCMGMCGGISAALTFAIPETKPLKRSLILLTYNLARILSYSILGGVAASISSLFELSQYPIARSVAGFLMVAMGLYLADWWRGINYLEKLGSFIWRKIKPIGDYFLPVKSIGSAVGLGFVWGWLPCGLVYTALALASAQDSVWEGAALMAMFGVGTLPALIFASIGFNLMRQWLAKSNVRTVFALMYMLFGLWTILLAWGVIPHSHSGHHDQHQSHRHH